MKLAQAGRRGICIVKLGMFRLVERSYGVWTSASRSSPSKEISGSFDISASFRSSAFNALALRYHNTYTYSMQGRLDLPSSFTDRVRAESPWHLDICRVKTDSCEVVSVILKNVPLLESGSAWLGLRLHSGGIPVKPQQGCTVFRRARVSGQHQ